MLKNKIIFGTSLFTLFSFSYFHLFPTKVYAAGSDDLLLKIQTDSNNEFTVPIDSNYTYNYNIDCDNDGTMEATGVTNSYTCSYGSAGTYTIRIEDNTGTGSGFPHIYFGWDGEPNLLEVQQWGTMKWKDMSYALADCPNLTITATDTPDLTNVTDMSGMFEDDTSFNQDISSWDVSSITDMTETFAGATNFNQPLNSWDVSSVTYMYNMFWEASAFNQPLDSWNTSSVEDMGGMFAGATNFNQPLNSWDTSSVTDIYNMFDGATAFNQPLDTWDLSNTDDLSYMFHNASAFNQDISSWDVTMVTNMSNMFANASSFNQDISAWNVSSVENMSHMFENAASFDQDISAWDVSSVSDMSYMFSYASAFNQDISTWEVSSVGNFSHMFNATTFFDQDLSSWDISSATDLTNMFDNSGLSTTNYDNILIGWDGLQNALPTGLTLGAANITYCNGESARNDLISTYSWTINDGGKDCGTSTPPDFIIKVQTDANNQFIIPIDSNYTYNYNVDCDNDGNWEATGVTSSYTCSYASGGQYSIRIGDNTGNGTGFPHIHFWSADQTTRDNLLEVEQWGTMKWQAMDSAFYMCHNFNITAPDTPDLSNVTNADSMFYEASSLNAWIGDWDISNITNMHNMFKEASHFNQDISSWDVSNVGNMGEIFNGATKFNQDLSSWNISNVTDMTYAFNNTSLSRENYDDMLNAWNSLGTLQNNVTLSANGSSYCFSEDARNNLISAHGWSITDAGKYCGYITESHDLSATLYVDTTNSPTVMEINYRLPNNLKSNAVISVTYDKAFTGGSSLTNADINVTTTHNNIGTCTAYNFSDGYFDITCPGYAASDELLTIRIGGSNKLTTPSQPGNYDPSIVIDNNNKTYLNGATLAYVGNDNDVNVTAYVPAVLDLEIYTASSNATTKTCDLGALSVNQVNYCTYEIAAGTNNSTGLTVKMRGVLTSDWSTGSSVLTNSDGVHTIAAVTDGDVTAGYNEYGFRIIGLGDSDYTPANNYNSQTSTVPNSETTIATTSGPIDGIGGQNATHRLRIAHFASMSNDTVSGNYSQGIIWTAYTN